jgi:phosphatidylglycerophosphatase A
MRIREPTWPRLLPSSIVVNAATLGPVGRLPAPGTWGSFAGLGWFVVIIQPSGFVGGILLSALLLYFAFAVCGEAERRMTRIDPPELIMDEFASMPLVYLALEDVLAGDAAWAVLLLGLLLFRFFDIVKPFGIRGLQRFPGGAGVLVDDVAAALVSCVILHGLTRFTPLLQWVTG